MRGSGCLVFAFAALLAASSAPAFGTPPPIVFDAVRHTPAGSVPSGLVAADFDGDGRSDLAVANAGTHDVSILLGRNDGTFFAVTPAIVSPHPNALAAADFNGDGRQDLVGGDYNGKSVVVAFGSGGGLFGAGSTYDAGMQPTFVATGDFNGDHRPDILVGGVNFGMSVLLNLGNGAMGTRIIVVADQLPPQFGGHVAYRVGDLDADGLDDIALAGWESVGGEISGQGFTYYRSLGNGSFSSSFNDGQIAPFDLALADWDRDGRNDVWLLGQDGVNVYRSLGDGSFAPPTTPSVVDASGLAVADLNRDGLPDAALGVSGQSHVVLKAGLADGTLGPDGPLPLSDTFRGMVAADFNGDALPDLALLEQSLNSIGVYLNHSVPPPAGEAALDPGLIQVTGFSLATGMLDFTYGPACQAVNHNVVLGDLASPARGSYSGIVCGIGTSGASSFNPGPGSVFFLVVGNNGTTEGSYGLTSQGIERPEATGLAACDLPQALGACP